jgi:hypothetical protein
MSDYRIKIDEAGTGGVRFELYQFARKSYALGMPTQLGGGSAAGAGPVIHLHPPHGESARQVRIVLEGGVPCSSLARFSMRVVDCRSTCRRTPVPEASSSGP